MALYHALEAAPLSPSVIAFYSAVAGLVPILFIAFAFQIGLKGLWKYEEPLYKSIFPAYVLFHGTLAVLAEMSALLALLTDSDNAFTRLVCLAGVVVPMMYLVLGLVFQAQDMRADFDWNEAFRESQERSDRLRAAKEARKARRRLGRQQIRAFLAARPAVKPAIPDVLFGVGMPAFIVAVASLLVVRGSSDPGMLVLLGLMVCFLGFCSWFWLWRPYLRDRLGRGSRRSTGDPEA